MAEFDHLRVSTPASSREFRSTLSVRAASPAQRDRLPHGQRLLAQLAALRERQPIARIEPDGEGARREGMAIVLEIKPRGFLDFSKLDWSRDRIEVLNVVQGTDSDTVVLFVPDGRLESLEARVRSYLEQNTRRGVPKLASLVNVIENIRKAAFDELWTDTRDVPSTEERAWLQVWLRLRHEGPAATFNHFARICQSLDVELESSYVTFPGRVVVALRSTRAELEGDLEVLDSIAEIRRAEETAEFFLADLNPAEQSEWVHDLAGRVVSRSAEDASAYVTLLDTGVAYGHPLLAGALAPTDAHAVSDAWITTDHHGHGTQMAGIALHGNLVGPLASSLPHQVDHRLESVNILPASGENPSHLYGWIVEEAARRVEAVAPQRRRTFAMAVTATGPTTGAPTEWSASIDQLAFAASQGLDDSEDRAAHSSTRLFVISAGNVPWTSWGDYPSVNLTSAIESPGQAWNALTVGASTELAHVDPLRWPSATAIAQMGGLSPSSTTSLIWHSPWPFKPDVVAEGGNGCVDRAGIIVGPDSVRLLTTHREYSHSLITDTGDTSAAAAEVARLCARLADRYPDHWPETIRALVIHGARYTSLMRAGLPQPLRREDKRSLIRTYGYGLIGSETSLRSSERRPTLIVQELITPYKRDGSAVKLNEMKVHDLPWPTDQLAALGEAKVDLRITLSYFVEPNPSQRGWQSKFRYQSQGLRFAVQAATESDEEFHQRINRIDRDAFLATNEDEVESRLDPDSSNWMLGSQMRNRGSVHSDVWSGTAVQLASKSRVAVFPVGGWWKDWKNVGRPDSSVRYALVVSLEVSSDVDVDLYTPILTKIGVPTVIEVV